MSTEFSVGFGSDAFFRQMKQLWSTDQNEAAVLLMEQVKRVCRQIIRDPDNGFYDVTHEDFEDYRMEAWLKMWANMKQFLSDPRNDPDSEGPHYMPEQKSSWARRLILWEMQHMRDRKLGKNPRGPHGQRIKMISTDYPAGGDAGDTPLGIMIPDPNLGPEDWAVIRDSVRDALEKLFSLPNNTETLTAVVYSILIPVFEGRQSMNDTADRLNHRTILQAVEEMKAILAENGMDPGWMLPLQKRLEKEGDRRISGLTGARLTNRRNSVLDAFRKKARSIDESGRTDDSGRTKEGK